MDSGERTKLECSRGVQQGNAMGAALFCLPLWPVLVKVREGYESQGGPNLCIPRRHHYRSRRDISRDGRSGALPRQRVDSEGHTSQPRQDGCLGPEGTQEWGFASWTREG